MQNTEILAGSNQCPGSIERGLGLLLGWATALLLAMPAASGQHLYQIALDTDESSATGCALDFPSQGSLPGFEALVELRVDPNYAPPRVDSVRLVPCQANDWNIGGTTTPSAGDWNVGVDSGQGGGDFAEGFVPLDSLGSPASLRLAVRSTSISGDADDIDSQVASPMLLELAGAVPALEPVALFLLAGALLGVAFLLRRQRALQVLVVLLALGVGVRAVQALPVPGTLNGLAADWVGIAALASDPAADAGDPAADLRAFFAKRVATDLVFRFDLGDLEGACAAPGDPACDGVCGASDADPGDCNGVCEIADAAAASADCDGTCDAGDEAGSFDCVASGGDCPEGSPPEESSTCGWSDFGDFGACSNSCGNGTQSQTRTCSTGSPGSSHCAGSDTNTQACTDGNGICGWSDWHEFDACSNPCGDGITTRTRSCFSNNPSANCQGFDSDSAGCTDGGDFCGWTEWGGFDACSNSCGDGTAIRTRECFSNNPSANCQGPNSDSTGCTDGSDFCGWSDWSGFDACSNSCGDGTMTRTRSCLSNNPNANCLGPDSDIAGCTAGSTTCGWGSYGSFGACSNSCGDGTMTRTRSCLSNAPWANCQGSASDSTSCTNGSTTCGWSSYGSFGSCSAICGGGTQSQTRTCNSNNTGANCQGSSTNSQSCNTQVCLRYELLSGETLGKYQFISSPDENCQLYMQSDGNLQVSCGANSNTAPGTGALVASDWFPTGTPGNVNAYATMQGDGNFVLYDSSGMLILWDTQTSGFGGVKVTLNNNGVVYIRNGSNTSVWSSLIPGGGSGCDPFDPFCEE